MIRLGPIYNNIGARKEQQRNVITREKNRKVLDIV